MKLAQTLLKQNGITPKEEAENKDKSGNQSGGDGGSSAENKGGGNNDDGNNLPPGGDKNKQGAGAGGGEGSGGSGTDDTPLDEATIIKGLKAQGIDVNSFEELKTKTSAPKVELTTEQIAEQEQQRKNKIRSYALTTGQVTTTMLDSYARES